MLVMTDEIPAPDEARLKSFQAEVIVQDFLALDPGENLRAELIRGEVVVSPAPSGTHEHVIAEIMDQMYEKSKVRMHGSGHKGLVLPGPDGFPDDHVIPDLVLAPKARRLFHGARSWMAPDEVAMVVEVTSSRAHLDRDVKRRSYARAGIPLYLLVDRDKDMVSLFSDPHGEQYTELPRPFGEPVPLPEPFGFDLDTGDFT